MNKKNLTKKSISLFVALSIVLAAFACPTVYAEQQGEVTAGEIEFLYPDGTNAYSFDANDELTVSCDITNSSVPKGIGLYVGLYTQSGSSARMTKVTAKTKDFAPNETYTISDTFAVPSDADEGYYIKAFVMSDELVPYACSKMDISMEDADEYFTQTPSLYRCYAPGVLRTDEGTIELSVCPDRPSSEFGNGYDIPFSIMSSVKEDHAENNIFAVCIPQLGETRTEPMLQIVMKNRTGATYLEKPFSIMPYEVGQKLSLAITWKVGGSMCLYVTDAKGNRRLIGTNSLKKGIEEDTLSYCFSADKEGPFHISEIKISSKQLSMTELSKPDGYDATSSDVTLVTSNNLQTTTIKKSNWHKTSKYHTTVPAYRAEKQIYYAGEDVVYPVMSINHSGTSQKYDIDIDVSDAEGEKLLQKSASIGIKADSKYHINELPIREIKTPGLYRIHTRISAQDETYSEYDSAIAVIPKLSGVADGALGEYYGHHVNYDSDISVFKKLNVSSARMWFYEFLWSNLEPAKDSWQWQRMDDYVDMCEAANIDILGVLGYPSLWAAQEPTQAERDECLRYEYRPNRWKPKDINEWENYVYTVVDRYKGRIKYWEVYNEVNFHPPYSPASFSGSTQDYAELLGTAYAAAKRADPDCTVVISGFSSPSTAVDSNMPLEFVKDKYKSGYYDVFNVHGYAGASAVNSWLNAYKTAKPGIKAFMTEEYPYQRAVVSDRAYASVKTPLEFLKAGYDRYFHFGMFSQEDVFITKATLSPTESYQAVGVLQANLRKCNSMGTSYTGFNNSAMFNINEKLIRTDGKTLSIFGAGQSEFEISVKGNIISCTDIYGREIATEVQGDVTKIRSKDILYITSDGALQITNAKPVDDEDSIIKNGGFEDIDGDIAAVGLSNCTPSDWTLRKVDTKGTIVLSKNVYYTGNYGLWIKATGGGKVYVFQDVDLPSAGKYQLKVKMRKNADNGDMKPYAFFFDRDNSKTYNTYFTLSNSNFTEQTATFAVTAPTKTQAAVGVGIYSGTGAIYIDDVEVVKISD